MIAQRKMGARKLKQEKGWAAPAISLYTMWLYPQENLGLPFSFLVRCRVQFLIQKQTLYSKTCHSRYGSLWGGLEVLLTIRQTDTVYESYTRTDTPRPAASLSRPRKLLSIMSIYLSLTSVMDQPCLRLQPCSSKQRGWGSGKSKYF